MIKKEYNFFRRLAVGLTAFVKSFNNPEREKEIIFENEKVNTDGSSDYKKKLYNFIRSHSDNDKQIAVKYTLLYKEYVKKSGINLSRLAQNSNKKKTIEYAEHLDNTQNTHHLVELYALAVALFGDQASQLREDFYKKNEA